MALVTLYRETGYSDSNPVVIRSPGEYPIIDNIGFPNDKLKSIRVAPKVEVQLYEHYEFKGRSIILNGPTEISDLGALNFNNQTSSIKVLLPSLVDLYPGEELQGEKVSIYEFGRYPVIDDIGFPNDKLKSIRVAPGVIVTLYENYSFQGDSMQIVGPILYNKLGNFNNKTSSIKVERMPLAVLYSQTEFRGTRRPIYEFGHYPLIDRIGFPNDALQSIKVAPGVKVDLYEDYEFKGKKFTIEGEYESKDLHPVIKNRISSIIVSRSGQVATIFSKPITLLQAEPQTPALGLDTPSPEDINSFSPPSNDHGIPCLPNFNFNGAWKDCPIVIIYTDDNFRGTSVPITQIQDISSFNDVGFPLRSLSSIKVAPGITIILYENENFDGASFRIDGPAHLTSLNDFNDRASSARILPTSNIPSSDTPPSVIPPSVIPPSNTPQSPNPSGNNLNYHVTNNWFWIFIIILIIVFLILLLARR
jgi:hypothetical protein